MKINLIFLILIISSIGYFVSAQDFEVAPVLVSFDANPGETQTKKLTIRNHSAERQKFIINLTDYELTPDGGKKPEEAGSSPNSLTNWLIINPSFLELNPNESAEVELIMQVPRTGFNTRWGKIDVQVAKEQTESTVDKQLATGVILVPRIAVLVKQSPRANQNYKAAIQDFKEVTKPQDKYRSFEATIINTGDKIIDAKVYLALANMETAEEEKFPPKHYTVYPGFERKIKLTLPVSILKGTYAIAILMDYGNNTPIEGAQLLLEVE